MKQTCYCGQTYDAKPCLVASGRKKYCSRKCADGAKRLPIEVVLWSRVDRRGPDECWPWLGPKRTAAGYGAISVNRRMNSPHRVAYMVTHGAIPPGAVICHSCDNPGCCNPAHLRADTQQANIADQSQRGRRPLHERHPMGKLTLTQKRAIKAEYNAGGVTLKQLGDRYGVTPTHIMRVARADHG